MPSKNRIDDEEEVALVNGETIYKMIIFFGYFIIILAIFSIILGGVTNETIFPLIFSIIVAVMFIVIPILLLRRYGGRARSIE